MKKFVSLLLSVVMLLSTVTAFAADNEGGADHEHIYGEWRVLVPATCNMKGRETRTCSVCEATEGRDIAIDPNNHTPSDWHLDEHDKAYHVKSCIGCYIELDKQAHSGTPATCKEPAFCNVCYQFYGSLSNVHTYDEADWTPDVDGRTHSHMCTVCKEENTLEKEEHNWDDGVVTKPATCTATGSLTLTCRTCHTKKIVTIDVDEDAHNMDGNWTTDGAKHWHKCLNGCGLKVGEAACTGGKAATCQERSVCDICNQPYGKLAEHNYGDLIPEVPATCTENGTKAHKTCTKCNLNFDADGNEITDLVIPATGHDFNGQPWVTDGESHWHVCKNGDCTATDTKVAHSSTDKNEATCKAKAKCDVCGVEYGEKAEHEAAGEWFSGGKGSHYKACKWCNTVCEGEPCRGGTATCVDKAVCDVCKTHYGEVNANNHKLPDNWTSTGKNTHVKACELCKLVVEDERCSGGTANCVDKAVCDVCGTEYGEVNANNHKDLQKIGHKDATCTQPGQTDTIHCDACNTDVEESQVIPATGHDWGDWNVTKEPTCTEEGSRSRVCKNDSSHVETEAIAKKPVDPVNPTDPTKPATGDAGVGVWGALLTVSVLLGTAIVVKKRHA